MNDVKHIEWVKVKCPNVGLADALYPCPDCKGRGFVWVPAVLVEPEHKDRPATMEIAPGSKECVDFSQN